MAVCEYCGVEFTGRTKRARYCSDKHRVYADRQRKRAARESERVTLNAADRALLERFRKLDPVSAARIDKDFIDVNGVDCTRNAIMLALSVLKQASKNGLIEAKSPVHA
jgi:hypothetical protein